MRRIFYIIFWSFPVFAVVLNVLKNANYLFAIPEQMFYVSLIILQTRVFNQIYNNLKQFHVYEFERSKRNMLIMHYVGLLSISFILLKKLDWSVHVGYATSKW